MKKCMLIGLAVLFVGAQAIAVESQKDTKRPTKRCQYCFGSAKAQAEATECTCGPRCKCAEKGCRCCTELDCACCKKATRNSKIAKKDAPEETIMTVKEGEEFDLQMPDEPGHNWRIVEGRDQNRKLKDYVDIGKPQIGAKGPGATMVTWTLTAKKAGNPQFSMRLVPEGSRNAVEIKKYAIVIEPK